MEITNTLRNEVSINTKSLKINMPFHINLPSINAWCISHRNYGKYEDFLKIIDYTDPIE